MIFGSFFEAFLREIEEIRGEGVVFVKKKDVGENQRKPEKTGELEKGQAWKFQIPSSKAVWSFGFRVVLEFGLSLPWLHIGGCPFYSLSSVFVFSTPAERFKKFW